MPEFSSPLSPVQTDFSPVRAAAPASKDWVGQGLSAIVEGVATFGKSSAREAGQQAALDQSGLDLSQEQVNRETDDIQKLIQENLSTEKDIAGGPISQRRIVELKDKSLRELSLTDRHIQSLIDAGVMSSTEGNARRRIALAKRMNEGSNFLFRDEFINAMSSVTGGTSGSAAEALFPKTAEEIQAEALSAAQLKAQADFEEKVTGIQLLFPDKSREHISSELQAQANSEMRLKEIDALTKERTLNADEVSQRNSLVQSSASRSLEVQIGQMLDEKGLLGPNGVLALKTKIAQSAEVMRSQLAQTPNLSFTDRTKMEEGIKNWIAGSESRLDIYNESKFVAETVKILEDSGKAFGIAANPYAAMLISTNPELVKELNKKPAAAMSGWLRTRLGEGSSKNLDEGARYMRSISNFYLGTGTVDSYSYVADSLNTDAGKEEFKKPENASKFKKMFALAPADTAFAIGAPNYVVAVTRLGDEDLKNKAIEYFNFYQKDISDTITKLDSGDIKVRTELVGLGRRPKVFVDIPNELMDYPGLQEGIVETYKAYKAHSYLWEEQFATPEEAFNAFLSGEYKISKEDFTSTKKVSEEPKESKEPLSVQNNNPLNLRSFDGAEQVDTPSGKFAKFPSVHEGLRAGARDLLTKIGRGDDSIEEIINLWSPNADPENVKRGLDNKDYIDYIVKTTGIKPDKPLTEKDLVKLIKSMAQFEGGKKVQLSDADIQKAIDDAKIDR